jgi:hypothetical protein
MPSFHQNSIHHATYTKPKRKKLIEPVFVKLYQPWRRDHEHFDDFLKFGRRFSAFGRWQSVDRSSSPGPAVGRSG